MLLTCLICNSEEISKHLEAKDYITEENFTVYLCKSCGVGFTYPQPEEMDKYYPIEYRKYTGPVKWLITLLYRFYVKKWSRQFEKSGCALEIGCGSGWMLKALHDQGWEVVGLERTEEEANFASRLTGLKVLSGGLDAIKLKPTYDLIILFNVLEHVSDPRNMLSQCKLLLKEKGRILLSVPNIDSWQAIMMKSHWLHLDVPRHLFHFSRQSFAKTVELEGLEVVLIKNSSLGHDIYGWLQSVLNLLGFKQNFLTKSLMGKDNFKKLINPFGFVMGLIGILMFIPFMLLAFGSWLVNSGALMEIWVSKK